MHYFIFYSKHSNNFTAISCHIGLLVKGFSYIGLFKILTGLCGPPNGGPFYKQQLVEKQYKNIFYIIDT